MAKVREISTEELGITLTLNERTELQRIAADHNISFLTCVASAIEYVVSERRMESSRVVKDPKESPKGELATITMRVQYPENGPLSDFSPEEKGFVAGLLLETLDLCVQTIRADHHMKEAINGMERSNQGMGSSLIAVPIDGRVIADLLRRRGPDPTQGKIQEQGTEENGLPVRNG